MVVFHMLYMVIRNYWTSDSMIQPQMDLDLFRNISNLDLVKPHRIRDLIYTCIRLLFANFLTLKMLHHPMLAVTSITFFFVDDVKCGLYGSVS